MVMSGSSSAGTAFVEFDDVEVPAENIVGERGKAFKYIVSNFNHEVGTTRSSIYLWMVLNRFVQRLFISFQSLRSARVCIGDSTE